MTDYDVTKILSQHAQSVRLSHPPLPGLAAVLEQAVRDLRLLRAEITGWENWSNELASLFPEDAETWPGVNPEGAQESIITNAVRHLLAEREIWGPKKPKCPKCGSTGVGHSSEHLHGGMNPGWTCQREATS